MGKRSGQGWIPWARSFWSFSRRTWRRSSLTENLSEARDSRDFPAGKEVSGRGKSRARAGPRLARLVLSDETLLVVRPAAILAHGIGRACRGRATPSSFVGRRPPGAPSSRASPSWRCARSRPSSKAARSPSPSSRAFSASYPRPTSTSWPAWRLATDRAHRSPRRRPLRRLTSRHRPRPPRPSPSLRRLTSLPRRRLTSRRRPRPRRPSLSLRRRPSLNRRRLTPRRRRARSTSSPRSSGPRRATLRLRRPRPRAGGPSACRRVPRPRSLTARDTLMRKLRAARSTAGSPRGRRSRSSWA